MARLSREFFERPSPDVAKALLGRRLVRTQGKRISGIIVETEAYRGTRDPASHAYRGKTKRNQVMFGPPGHAYVYFTMGAHFCLNITTEAAGKPAAVLLRALEPMEGIGEMRRNRGDMEVHRLASGPGNLTRAMGIDAALNGEDMVTSKRVFVEEGQPARAVGVSSRVGISRGRSFKWRFFVKGSPFVSRAKPSA